MPDRNEIVSFAAAALATQGSVFIDEIEDRYLRAFLAVLDTIGAGYEKRENGLRFFKKSQMRAASVETAPHPAFMTDWQQPFVVLLTQADGESRVHETVYEDRFGYTEDLKRMGAHIEVMNDCNGFPRCSYASKGYNHVAYIQGPRTLRGTTIRINDIRAGIAHVIAALAAEGESVIEGVHHLDRGYEAIDSRLQSLGARIKRMTD